MTSTAHVEFRGQLLFLSFCLHIDSRDQTWIIIFAWQELLLGNHLMDPKCSLSERHLSDTNVFGFRRIFKCLCIKWHTRLYRQHVPGLSVHMTFVKCLSQSTHGAETPLVFTPIWCQFLIVCFWERQWRHRLTHSAD